MFYHIRKKIYSTCFLSPIFYSEMGHKSDYETGQTDDNQ